MTSASTWRDAEPEQFAAALLAAAEQLSVLPLAVEKDYWVCQALRAITTAHPGEVVFKGGTSLEKLRIIRRFSEDLDLLVVGDYASNRAAERALADRLIASDPTLGVVLPRKRKAEAAMSIPTNADVAKLLNAAEPPDRPKSRPGFTAYVALCAFAGLRRGEALGVQVGDVDFLARTLRITRQLQRAKPADIEAGKDLVKAAGGITVMIRPPKYESERTIYLPDELVAILSEHVRQHTTRGEPSRWLFDEDGKPWHDNLVDYRWRSTRTDAGVSYKLHELRHYYASGLIAAGCDVVTVQRAMGHASATTTLSTYAHLWPTAEDKTRAAASGMASAVLAVPRSGQVEVTRSRQ